MHHTANRSQHARIRGDSLEEIDMKLRSREVLARAECAEYREPHGTVGE